MQLPVSCSVNDIDQHMREHNESSVLVCAIHYVHSCDSGLDFRIFWTEKQWFWLYLRDIAIPEQEILRLRLDEPEQVSDVLRTEVTDGNVTRLSAKTGCSAAKGALVPFGIGIQSRTSAYDTSDHVLARALKIG